MASPAETEAHRMAPRRRHGSVRVAGEQPAPGVSAGVVFQQPRLFPWRSVGGNVDLALKYANVPRDRRTERRNELLERVGLEGTADRKIWEISGGQQQRVAIARALAADNPLFLLDEPFAGIDPIAVLDIQGIIRHLKSMGIGILITDHNVRETLKITDRAYIINNGEILRAGTPLELSTDPQVRKIYLGEDFTL